MVRMFTDFDAHPVDLKLSSIAAVWFGGKTCRSEVGVGVQVACGKFSACTTRSSALAVFPGASVTRLGDAVVDRVAAAPTWVNGVPVPIATPGYPNIVHAEEPVLVKSMFW